MSLYSAVIYAQIGITVEIHGVPPVLADNVHLLLSIEQQKNNPLLSEGRLHRLHKKAPQEIIRALQPYGYYKPTITKELIEPAPGQWQASYTIDPGPPLPVNTFDLKLSGEIGNDPEFQALLQDLPLREGATFNHLHYEDIKTSLAKLANERGYFDSRFIEHRVEIDLNAYAARIHLHYDGGARYRFGEIFLEQDILDPKLLQRYIPFTKGSFYTLDQIIDLQQALNDSDYFHNVAVSIGKPQTGTIEIPINVMLTPRKRHRYTVGLGYGTDTGARAKFGWERPRLNRRGHRFNTEAKISEIGYSMGLQYRVPILNPRTDQMIYSAGVINEKTDTSDSTLRTIGASLNHGRGRWRESVSLGYQQEDFVIGDDHGVSTLLIPGVSWSRIWGQDFIHTLDGLRFDISLRGASDKLGSDSSFSQLQGGIKGINPLGRNTRLILRGNLGGSWTGEFNELPSSVRFFAGGAQSVRGYAYQSLGPADGSGKVIGGKHLMTGSIELEHNLAGKWSTALFYDAGNAIDSFADKLERGAGFGLRWQSPVGPLRIDLANAVSRDERPWRIHINIGPDL